MDNNLNEESKTFTDSSLVIENRKNLKITGVEKIFETNENKIQIKVTDCILVISGKNLSVKKLDVNSGLLEISGEINELKYTNQGVDKGNFIRKIFK